MSFYIKKCLWRREWQPTPVFLPGEFHGQRSLVCYSPRGHKESDLTEQLTHSRYKEKSAKKKMLNSISGCSYEKQFDNFGSSKILEVTFWANLLNHTQILLFVSFWQHFLFTTNTGINSDWESWLSSPHALDLSFFSSWIGSTVIYPHSSHTPLWLMKRVCEIHGCGD